MSPTTVALGYLALIVSPVVLPLVAMIWEAHIDARARREFLRRAGLDD